MSGGVLKRERAERLGRFELRTSDGLVLARYASRQAAERDAAPALGHLDVVDIYEEVLESAARSGTDHRRILLVLKDGSMLRAGLELVLEPYGLVGQRLNRTLQELERVGLVLRPAAAWGLTENGARVAHGLETKGAER